MVVQKNFGRQVKTTAHGRPFDHSLPMAHNGSAFTAQEQP